MGKKGYKIIIAILLIVGSLFLFKNKINKAFVNTLPENNFKKKVGLVGANKLPNAIGYVNDFEGIFSELEEAQLDSALVAINEPNDVVLAIATADSSMLTGFTVKDYNVALAKYWGLGDANKNNGILILMSKQLQKIDIRVGSGIDTILTDFIVAKIIGDSIIPELKVGHYAKALITGAKRLAAVKKQH